MSENSTYKKERDIWNAQALKSFVKAKTDWFNGDDYDSRLHLSFVEHKGKPSFEPVKTIEIGVPMVKAGSDGSGKMGVTALGLCQMISNGVLARRCAAERQNFEKRKAAANGQRVYQQAIWSCIGGTTSKRAKDGKAEFRRFDIIPGQKDGTYALRAQSCEGECNSELGGVTPKKGAEWTQIIVPVDAEYLYALATNTIAVWNAHVAAIEMKKAQAAFTQVQQNASVPAQAPSVQAPVQAPAQETPKKPEVAYAFYDQRFYGPMGCAISPEAAIACAKKCLAKLSKEKNLVCKKKASENLFDEILNGRANADNTKNLWLTPLPLVHPDNPDSNEDTDVLFVMVYRNVY